MEEHQVSVDGQTYQLPSPFFVIATQNPVSQSGTFPLPESQLDRFLMCIKLGYPDERAERLLLEGDHHRQALNKMKPVMNASHLIKIQLYLQKIKAAPAVLDYLQRIIAFTRYEAGYAYGLSPRGGIALLTAARAWALIEGRDYLVPEDLQAVLAAVVDHRLQDNVGASKRILNQVQVLA